MHIRIGSLLVLLLVASTAAAQVITPFTPRFTANANGDIVLVGNTLMKCPAVAANCAAARNGTASPASQNDNNAYVMQFVDVDSDVTTFNSSRATLTLPDGSNVLFAGLYWAGDTSAGTAGVAAPNTSIRNQVRFAPPGSAQYQVITGTVLGTSNTVGADYGVFADVTTLVQNAGNGAYSVANVQAGTGNDRGAGWSLVVVYTGPGEPARNLTVFDGYASVTSTSGNIVVGVSGFTTPPAGTVTSRVGAVIMEGDLGITGDGMRLNSIVLTDAVHPSTNFFTSTISRLGTRINDKFPNDVNQQGLDLFMLGTTNVLGNSATSASIALTTTGDAYYPQTVTFATTIFAPQVTANKTVTDVNGGIVEPGDLLQYDVTVFNGTLGGSDNATNLVLRDALPAGTVYEPGSLQVVSGANSGVKTDNAGDDQAEIGAGEVVFRLGAGATSAAGGSLAPGASTSIRFAVRVAAGISNQTPIVNAADLTFNAATLGTPLTAVSNAVTVIAVRPLLELIKTGAPNPVQAGELVTWILSYANRGGANALNTVLSDTLPGNTAFVSASGGGTELGGVVTWSLGTVPAGVSGSLTVTSRVVAPLPNGTVLTNNAQLLAANADPATAIAPVTVTSAPFLTLEKLDLADPVQAGGEITYVLSFANIGSDVANAVALVDTLPTGTSFVSASGGGQLNGNLVNWDLGNLLPGATGQVGLTVRAPSPAENGTLLTNSAILSAANAAQVQAAQQTTLASAPRLTLHKTATPDPIPAGGVLTYSLEFANTGSDSATGVFLIDQLPAAVEFVSATAAGSWDPVARQVVWSLGAVPAGTTGQVSVKVQVATPLPNGFVLHNAATLNSSELAPVVAELDTTVTSSPVLSLVKTAQPSPAVAGGELVYSLSFANSGNADATSVELEDLLPEQVTFVSATGGGSYNIVTRTVTWSLADVPAGGNGSVSVTVAVTSPLPNGTPLVNVATLSSAETQPVSALLNTPVASAPLLSLIKTASPDPIEAGQVITYSLAFANNGNEDASGVVISDPLPTNTSFLSADANGTFSNGVVTWLLGALPAGATGTVSWTAVVASPLANGTPLSNSADLTSNETAPVYAGVISTVQSKPVLTITKAASLDTVEAGAALSYSVTVANIGNDSATGVSVTDLLPVTSTFLAASDGGTWDSTTGLVSWNLGTLAAGESRTLGLDVQVVSPLPNGTRLVNVATANSDQTPPTEAAATTNVASRPVLSLVKTGSPQPVEAGGQLTWTLEMSNTGNADATGVMLLDQLPAMTSFASATGGGLEAGGLVTWDIGALAVGATASYQLVVNVASPLPNGTVLLNSAELSSNEAQPVTAQQSTLVASRPVLSLSKVADQSPVSAGALLTFTLEYSNNGNADATGVVLTDSLPAGTSFVAASDGGAPSGNTVSWNLGTLAAGSTGQVTVTVSVSAPATNGASLVNTASLVSVETAPVGAMATAIVASSPVLNISKTASASDINAGETVDFTLTVDNSGTDAAINVQISDVLPAGSGFVSATGGGVYNNVAQTVNWVVGNIDAGSSVQFVVTVVADSPIANGTVLDNLATAVADNHPQVTANAQVVVASAPVLVLEKAGAPDPVEAGGIVTWTLTYSNTGTEAARDITLSDPIPPNTTFVSASAGGTDTGGQVEWVLGNLDAGASGSVFLQLQVVSPLADGTLLTNQATLSASNAADAQANDTLLVTSAAVLTLTNTTATPQVLAGTEVTFVLAFSNIGNDTAQNTILTNPLPANVQFVSATGGGTFANGVVTWDLGSLPVGVSGQVSITVTVNAPLANGTLIVDSGTIVANNAAAVDADAVVTVDSAPLLTLIKNASPDPVVAGGIIEYTLTFANTGTDDATNVVLVDTLPLRTFFVTASDSWNYDPDSRTVTWDIGTLPVGTSGVLSLTLEVDTPIQNGTRLHNQAELQSDQLPPVPASVETTVGSQPVISMIKTATPAIVEAGDLIDYTITLSNTGSDDAVGVLVTDLIPANTTYTASDGTFDLGTNTVTWGIGTLNAGSSTTLHLSVTTATPLDEGTQILNTAQYVAGNAPSGTAQVVTPVNSAPLLSFTKTALADIVTRGDYVDFVLAWRNDGNAPASDARITDSLPANTGFVSADGGGVYDAGAGIVTWVLGDIAPGAQGTVRLTLRVTENTEPGALISNLAELTSRTLPPYLAQAVVLVGLPVNSLIEDVPINDLVFLLLLIVLMLTVAWRAVASRIRKSTH